MLVTGLASHRFAKEAFTPVLDHSFGNDNARRPNFASR
jgi:hypothetical protein